MDFSWILKCTVITYYACEKWEMLSQRHRPGKALCFERLICPEIHVSGTGLLHERVRDSRFDGCVVVSMPSSEGTGGNSTLMKNIQMMVAL